MATIKVTAGDLYKAKWSYTGMLGSSLMTIPSTPEHVWKGESVNLDTEIESIEQLDEEKVKKLAGTAAWGLAGAALLGPLGAIGGMLIGGNKKEVAFVCNLKDGRKFMAITDGKTWQKIMAKRFDQGL